MLIYKGQFRTIIPNASSWWISIILCDIFISNFLRFVLRNISDFVRNYFIHSSMQDIDQEN